VVITDLQETAARLGGVELDIIIAAATWAFCRQDAATRRLIVADFWLRGLSELEVSETEGKSKTFKERVHALATYCYAAFRRRSAQ
jgi:hypothetical protein